MSDEKVSILVEAIDKASGVLSGVGGALKTLGGIAGGVALGGVAAFFGAVASGAGDARESAMLMAATSKTIDTMGNAAGVSAQHVADMASALSDAKGASLFGDDQIQQSSNLLLTFGEIKGATFDAATALTVDLAQALGGAPKDQAMMLGKALNDPIKGMTALGKAGLTFSEDQKAAIKAMQESGDMAGAQALIIAELNKQVGGQAGAAAAATGGWSEFTGRLGEAKETLGAAVLPLLNGLAGVLNDRVMPVVESLAGAFADLTSGDIGTFASDILELTGIDISPLLDTFNTISESWAVASEFTSSFAEQFGATIDLMSGADGTFQAIGAAISDLASGVQAAFSDGGIGGALQFLADKLAEVSPGFAILQGAVEAALPPIQSIVMSVFGIIGGFIQEHGAKIQADLIGAWQAIQGLIAAVLPPIQAIVGAIFGAIATFLHAHGDDIKAFLGTTWDQIAAIIKIAVELVKAIIVPVFTFVAGFLTSHSSEIQSILGGAWDAIKAIIDGALTLIKGVLTIALALIKGDWQGAWDAMKTTLGRVWEDVKTIISSAWGVIKTLFGGFAADAVSFGEGIVNSVVSGISRFAGKLADTISDAVGNAIRAGKEALHNAGVPGFASGVRNFSGGLALVGERGPELVSLPRGANVYSNSDTRSILAGGGAGGTINVYFNAGAIVGAPGQNVEQLADKVLDRIQNRISSRRAA